MEISPGKTSNLHHAPAASTSRPLDGIGLRHLQLARPDRAASNAIRVPRVADSSSSFLPTPPHDDAVAFDLWLVPSTPTGDSHPRAADHAERTATPPAVDAARGHFCLVARRLAYRFGHGLFGSVRRRCGRGRRDPAVRRERPPRTPRARMDPRRPIRPNRPRRSPNLEDRARQARDQAHHPPAPARGVRHAARRTPSWIGFSHLAEHGRCSPAAAFLWNELPGRSPRAAGTVPAREIADGSPPLA
jgi:hypothetical protein